VEVSGMQILGFRCRLLGKSPNPLPSIEKLAIRARRRSRSCRRGQTLPEKGVKMSVEGNVYAALVTELEKMLQVDGSRVSYPSLDSSCGSGYTTFYSTRRR